MEIKETTNQQGLQKPKKDFRVANEAFRERFQFQLKSNDNVICQRYFRIPGYNSDVLNSQELLDLLHTTVEKSGFGNGLIDRIEKELVEKSRIFMWYTREEPVKMTGFLPTGLEPTWDDVALATDGNPGPIQLSDGTVIDKTYFEWPEDMPDNYADNEKPESWDTTFTFEFLIDDKVVYQRIWDATVYPRYIRNSVDLANSNARYRDVDPSFMHFKLAIVRSLNEGRDNLINVIIRQLADLSGGKFDEPDFFTKRWNSGNKSYYLSTYNKDYVNGWREATMEKTKKYQQMLRRDEELHEQGGLTDGQWDYIEKYL